MTRVMDGGCTFSCSASSPGVMAWWTSRADRAASWVSDSTASVRPEAARCARRRRASLLTEIRSAVARPASVLVWVTVIIVNLCVKGRRRPERAWTKYITLAGRMQHAYGTTS
jgi:hypothetical protein